MKRKLRIWIISDPHKMHGFLDIPLDDIDMIICAGDITEDKELYLNANQALDFLEWFSSLEHIPYKVFIAGNHDTSIEKGYLKGKIPSSIVYLEHQLAVVGGLRIFGSPYTPTFGTGWAFNRKREKLYDVWQSIPENLDFLITHGPPKGVLDLATDNGRYYEQCGCKSLLNRVKEVKPKYHVFGHVHNKESAQNTGIFKFIDGETTFVNACVTDMKYNLVSNGLIIDYELNTDISSDNNSLDRGLLATESPSGTEQVAQ